MVASGEIDQIWTPLPASSWAIVCIGAPLIHPAKEVKGRRNPIVNQPIHVAEQE